MNRSEAIWQEYHSRLRAFIRGKVGDEAAADDILQDVFLKMHGRLASLRETARLQSWLYQIAQLRQAEKSLKAKQTPSAG